MPPIVTTADIACPAAEVFAYATDASKFREWQKGVVDGHMDGPAETVGAICTMTRRIGGANRTSTSELVHVAPPRTWRVEGQDGPVRAAVDVLVEPVTDTRSRLTITVDFTGFGIGKLLVPMMVRPQAARKCPPTWPRSNSGWKLRNRSGPLLSAPKTATTFPLFRQSNGKVVRTSTYTQVWRSARALALVPEQAASPLVARPYDLRHAAVSLWLNAGVPAPTVARRAGHSVDVLLRVYANCIDGDDEVANRRITKCWHSLAIHAVSPGRMPLFSSRVYPVTGRVRPLLVTYGCLLWRGDCLPA